MAESASAWCFLPVLHSISSYQEFRCEADRAEQHFVRSKPDIQTQLCGYLWWSFPLCHIHVSTSKVCCGFHGDPYNTWSFDQACELRTQQLAACMLHGTLLALYLQGFNSVCGP